MHGIFIKVQKHKNDCKLNWSSFARIFVYARTRTHTHTHQECNPFINHDCIVTVSYETKHKTQDLRFQQRCC